MSRWWRAYDEAVDDPKLILLSDKQHRAWFNLCCVCSQNNGKLPAVAVIAIKLRTTAEKAKAIVAELAALGLVDVGKDGAATMHNWDGRQFQSDVSTARVKRFRKQRRNVSSTVSETPPETEAETETERKEDTADAVPPPYAFEAGVIRLSAKDFDRWKASFSYLDLAAELCGLAEWAGEQGKDRWFHAVSGALAKRNREAKSAADKVRNNMKPGQIEGILY